MNNKVSQKLEIIGFKESVKKYTTIYFFIYFLYYIYVLPVFSVDEISPNKTEAARRSSSQRPAPWR